MFAAMQCGFCFHAPADPPGTRADLVVVGDSIVGEVAAPDTADHGRRIDLTVDGLFEEIEKNLRDERRQIIGLELHPYYGYPIRWETDDARNFYSSRFVTDQGYWGRVVSFVVDSIHTRGKPVRSD